MSARRPEDWRMYLVSKKRRSFAKSGFGGSVRLVKTNSV